MQAIINGDRAKAVTPGSRKTEEPPTTPQARETLNVHESTAPTEAPVHVNSVPRNGSFHGSIHDEAIKGKEVGTETSKQDVIAETGTTVP